MPKFNSPVGTVKEGPLARLFTQWMKILNGGINFGQVVAGVVTGPTDNMSGILLPFNFTVINTDTNVDHNLARIPNGYIVMQRSGAMAIYNGVSAWTIKTITLRSSVVGTAIIFVW